MFQRRSQAYPLWLLSLVPTLLLSLLALPALYAQSTTTYTVYTSQNGEVQGSEILDITPDARTAVVVGSNNVGENKLRLITIDPATGLPKRSSEDFKTRPAVAGLGLAQPVFSSVAMHPTRNFALVTVRDLNDDTKAGGAVFIDVASLALVRDTPLPLGLHPESVAIAPNGNYAVVANQGGSISIIDLRSGAGAATVSATITPTVPDAETTREQDDPQPEAVAISPDSTRAFVTLQRNNAITIIDINPTTLATDAVTRALPYKLGGGTIPLRPDGLAITPDGNYLVTANEGVAGSTRPNSVSLFRVGADRTLNLLADTGNALPLDSQPEMVDVGTIGNRLRAYVTLERTDQVAVLHVDTANGQLQLEQVVDLNPSSLGSNTASSPEGIKIAKPQGMELIVTANVGTRNVSVLRATTSSPSPSPSPATQRVHLPLVIK